MEGTVVWRFGNVVCDRSWPVPVRVSWTRGCSWSPRTSSRGQEMVLMSHVFNPTPSQKYLGFIYACDRQPVFSLSVLVLQQLPLVGQRSKCNIDQSPELNCRSQGDSFKLVLSSRTMGVCLESPVLWTFFFFPSVQYNSDIKCIVYILNSFGPKTRRIKEIKLPFVPTVGTFFSPKHPSILNLFSSPETRQ